MTRWGCGQERGHSPTPSLGLLFGHENHVRTALGSLQPAELSSDTHACTHTCAHTDTCTHTYVHTPRYTNVHAHTYTHTHAVLCFHRQDSTQVHRLVHPQPGPCVCPACVCTQGHVWSCCTQRTHTQVPAHPHRACVHSCACHLRTHPCTQSQARSEVHLHTESVHMSTQRLCTDTLVHVVPVHSSTPAHM